MFYSEELFNIDEELIRNIDFSKFHAGKFILKLCSGNQMKTLKIIKN